MGACLHGCMRAWVRACVSVLIPRLLPALLLVGPSITISPRNLTVRELDTASFFCGASARPAPNFTWFFIMPGSDLPMCLPSTNSSVLDAGFNMLGEGNSTLVLKGITFSMRGLYQCSAMGVSNGLTGTQGSAILKTTAQVYLTVNGKDYSIENYWRVLDISSP